MHAADIEADLEGFVRRSFSVDTGDDGFTRHTDLYEGGYVDSVGLAELLEFVSSQFGVEVPDDDLLSDDFSTIAGMARVIVRIGTA
jgi:acyl carrier protein